MPTTVNPAKLVAAPILQDTFVDNATDVAMSNGVITCYKDNSRTTLKNWYYQTGVPGNYTYTTLPNPLTLSAAGTITDANGVDTIPFFYPWSELDQTVFEPYYITVDNSNGQRQFTRQNFPYIPQGSTPGVLAVPTLDNVIVNNVFWQRDGIYNATFNTFTINATNILNRVIAPSQHDGFLSSDNTDVRFIKNISGGADTITFTPFGQGNTPLTNDITPEFYLNLTCSNTPAGETNKCIQIPLSMHIDTLQNVTATFTIWAQNVTGGGGGSNQLNINLIQFLGTGAAANPAIPLQTLTLTTAWSQYTVSFTFPTSSGFTLGSGADDCFLLQIQYPLNTPFNINIAKPSMYLSTTVPTNDFTTYDQVDSVINTPRTGDVRTSINLFYPFGWVPMNDGTIGNASSNATTRASVDTWQLFNLIWNSAQPYDSGSNSNPIAQMYTSGGSATNYGVSAIADFNANNQLALTRMFGKVVTGSVPLSALLAACSQAITASNSGGNLLITVPTGGSLFPGQAVTFTTTGSLPGNLVANAVYYITNIFGGTFNVATTYANALSFTVIAWSSAGSNSTVNLQPLGSSIGEYFHTLTINEMPAHTHTYTTLQSGASLGAGNVSIDNATANTGSTGGGFGHNNMQPSTFYNIYMKL